MLTLRPAPAPRAVQFEVPYDILVCSQGEMPATFGVKGVEQYAYFMKEISDTQGLRKRIQVGNPRGLRCNRVFIWGLGLGGLPPYS